jgi:hypothetical protein
MFSGPRLRVLGGTDALTLRHGLRDLENQGDSYHVGDRHPQRENGRTVDRTGQLDYERTCSSKKETMASSTAVRTPYLHRLDLVTEIIKTHSKLGDKAASELAVHILHELNSIPEKVR